MKKYVAALAVFLVLTYACKQSKESEQPILVKEAPHKEASVVQQSAPLLIELAKFASAKELDSQTVEQLFLFKKINTDGTIETITMDMAIDLYGQITKREGMDGKPIFEIKDTNMVILPVKGIGFGGPIWAKVLVDRPTMEIKKIEFEHKSESEGYGAAMTQKLFEDQFVGVKIDFEKDTYVLQRNLERRIDDGTIIDGISGATMTTEGALEMVNEGLKGYRGYFEQK